VLEKAQFGEDNPNFSFDCHLAGLCWIWMNLDSAWIFLGWRGRRSALRAFPKSFE
jgi:hypothetical protein